MNSIETILPWLIFGFLLGVIVAHVFFKQQISANRKFVEATAIENKRLSSLLSIGDVENSWIVFDVRNPPDTGWEIYAVWNGRWWQKASYLNIKGYLEFCGLDERPIRGITHYKRVGRGPEEESA